MMKKKGKKRGRSSKGAENFALSSEQSRRETAEKKEQIRKRLKVVHLQRELERKETELRKTVKNPQEPKPKRPKGPLRPEEWKLKGPARPAAMLARIEAGELDERGDEIPIPPETYDLLQQVKDEGRMGEHPETREYLRIMRDLAGACCEAGKNAKGIRLYEEVMKLDEEDASKASEGLACALVDEGRGVEARALLEKRQDVASAVLAYCRVVLEYVSWEVLEEEGASEEVVREALKKAYALNPFIAVFISMHESFFQAVEYVEEIPEPAPRGSIDECFLYCSRNMGVWIDTVGACAWIEKELETMGMPSVKEGDASDSMYIGMYETAVEMHQESVE